MVATNAGLRLTADQLEALRTAMSVAESAGHMSLIGPAGCGKTTTIRAIAHSAVDAAPRKGVLLLAPTHKARQQFAAASLPRGVKRQTIHRFIGVSPSTWRDEDKFNLSNSGDVKRVEETKSRYSLVIVDESSMVCRQHARKALDICMAAEIGIIFSGDPYQLPPVTNGEQSDDDTDGPDFEVTETTMAPEFIDAPIKVNLNKVLRHGGPILEYVTFIRRNWELDHTFPSVSAKDSESEIKISDDPMEEFIVAYRSLYEQFENGEISCAEIYRQSPRALCFTNYYVHRFTNMLRLSSLGDRAGSQWVPAEIVMVKNYCAGADPKFIPSATDAVVVDSQVVDVDRSFNLKWTTPKQKLQREVRLHYQAKAQILSLQLISPDGTVNESTIYKVGTGLIGDKEAGEQYRTIKQKLLSCQLSYDHEAWKWLKRIKEQFRNPITSAFVMTVHKSQGSTFKDVYVCRDILRAENDRNSLLYVRNSLLYVAATRASRSITFGR
jgi:exodeoxyribonuclease V